MLIQDVYADATVFVTGATGFVGKGFVEKILRTCTKVRKVIVLIRFRKNRTAETRLQQMKENAVFDRIRATNPAAMDKLSAVVGDIGISPRMGLSASDEQMLVEEVDFVFHSAATVSFGLPFEVTANLNIMGTKRMLDLSRRMKNLKSFVYVSTAYTGVMTPLLEEKLQPVKKPINMEKFIHVLATGTPEEKLHEAHQYQDDHPNTYTFSKVFAEHLVNYYFQTYHMPICIVRPSIIGSAHAEPTPGWIDSFNGIIGVISDPARGATRYLFGKGHTLLDIVPIDFVCNLMAVAAWWTIVEKSSEIRIYNHTTGNFQPLSCQFVNETAVKYGRIYPSKYSVLRPELWMTDSHLAVRYNKWVYQMIPAYVADLFLRLRGEQPKCVELSTIYNKVMNSVVFFRMNQFKFCNDSVVALIDASQAAGDHAEFMMDFRTVDTDGYVRDMWLGIRQYLYKEDISDVMVDRSKRSSKL